LVARIATSAWKESESGYERENREKSTYKCRDYAIWVGRWPSVPVLGDLFLAGKPDVSIVGSGNAKEGLENIPVKISLDVFL
jgi:hypothetical protein